MSSTSLAMPPKTRDFASETGPRPGTAGSMRGFGDRTGPPSLHLDFSNVSLPAFGSQYRSPLSLFEGLDSPIKSDTDSLLGDEPEKIADEIEARIAREAEEKIRAKAAEHERRWAQAQMEAQRKKFEAQRMACPSPPASIASEHDVPSLLVPGPKPSPRPPASPLQDVRPASRGYESNAGVPTVRGPGPGPRAQAPPADDERPSPRGARLPVTEGPLSVLQASAQDALANSGPKPGLERSKTEPSPGIQLLKPQPSQDPTRSATVPAPGKAPRSPLFQQIGPFDAHSEEGEGEGKGEDDKDEPKVDHRAANAPYGLPSPPLSHRTRPSDEESESRPVLRTVVAKRNTILVDRPGDDEDQSRPILRTVEAKRDTVLIGRPSRASLDLQIDEFEKHLQQAQAMSALENRPGPGSGAALQIRTRSRTNSNGSSNYSDMSESPMTMEPPLVSPKPFPLSPRPMSPGGRLRASTASTAEAAGTREAPIVEVAEGSAFGSVMRRPADIQTRRRRASGDRSGHPDEVSLRVRVVAAATPPRPTPGDHAVAFHKPASPAGRVRRPSPDEYQVGRTGDAPRDLDSPVLKDTLPTLSLDQISDTFSEGSASAGTSRANSPVSSATGSGSYSVFSPPPPPATRRPVAAASAAPPRSVKPEWFGPAPTAPPTSPLPIPERIVARRKDTFELATRRSHERLAPRNPPAGGGRSPQRPAPGWPPGAPSLASSASIVPDTDANPNWPLPSPKNTTTTTSSSPFSSSSSPPPSSIFPSPPSQRGSDDGGFTARRSLFRDKRAPPAPLNIAATRYADESMMGGGPWTPDAPAAGAGSLAPPPAPQTGAERPRTAGHRETVIITPAADAGFDFLKGSPPPPPPAAVTVSGGGEGEACEHGPDGPRHPGGEEDRSAAIGVARGLSIRYDRVRGDAGRRERGAAARERKKKQATVGASPAWRLEEGEEEEEEGTTAAAAATTMTTTTVMLAPAPRPGLSSGPASPALLREPLDRTLRPNRGLKSPTGIADEQGVRFI